MATSDRDVLPSEVKPHHYDLSIYDVELGGDFKYKGKVAIQLKCQKHTKSIQLNALQLQLRAAKVISSSGSANEASNISYDEPNQRTTLDFQADISEDSTLEIDFTGTMNSDMAGFYRSRYKPAVDPVASVPKVGENHYMFSTQFESCDARRAFPCFDEPNLKATFDFEIEIPTDQVALSNMPAKATRSGSEGRHFVSFERTPIMSTYLLAWAFGDFTYVEAMTERKYNGKPLPVRVYTTRGLEEQGRFALEHAHKTLDYFSEIFGLEYPLPKSDLLAVHEFSYGAMENWGLVTYRTTALLFDEKTSDARFKKRIAYVVAHELAHQWFGNLVTMDWWSELWLNEGFATWVGWLATDHLHPEWDYWAEFVADSLQSSLDLDSLRSSHPIEVPVRNALEIDQVFDAISYRKGSSVIRMLSAHLTVPIFLKGVSEYLKKHAYGNATTTDLWAALSKASGKDVPSFMDDWVRKIGYPVVTVTEEPGQITVRQSRFLVTGDVKPDEDHTLWWLPMGLMNGPDSSNVTHTALYAREDILRSIDDSFYKLNADATGFYRTNYPPARLAKLGSARAKLSLQDRIGLVGDAEALALSGHGTAAGLMSLCAEFSDETHYLVWTSVISALGTMRSVFAKNDKIAQGLNKYILKLIGPTLDRVGWTAKPDESLLDGQLRALMLSTAGSAGHEATIKEANRQFEAYQSGDSEAINPSLRLPVLRTVVRSGDKSTYDWVKQHSTAGTGVELQVTCLTSMGKTQSPELARDLLDFNMSDAVAIQDVHAAVASLAANSKARDTMWVWFKENWTLIEKKLSGNSATYSRFVRVALINFADHETEQEIVAFFKDKDTKAFDKLLQQVSDTIKRNANFKQRDEALLTEWLVTNGYAGEVERCAV